MSELDKQLRQHWPLVIAVVFAYGALVAKVELGNQMVIERIADVKERVVRLEQKMMPDTQFVSLTKENKIN